jgi:lipid-A-disaccharide synthase
VEFVGHPLVELLEPAVPRDRLLGELGLAPSAPTVALLPGSRRNEVRLILPAMTQAAPLIARQVPDVQFVLARAPHLDSWLFEPFERAMRAGTRGAIVEARTDAVLAASDIVVTASGTATIQTALHERPMVIVYRLSPLTYRLGIRFVKVDTYGMVNLVAGRRVAPELIQDACTPAAIAHDALRYLADPVAAESARSDMRDVKARLGGAGASRRAARNVLDVARRKPVGQSAGVE